MEPGRPFDRLMALTCQITGAGAPRLQLRDRPGRGRPGSKENI